MAKPNRVSVVVKDIRNVIPEHNKPRDKWEKWKVKPCDAGFKPGDEMIFEEGVKLVKGRVPCFSALYNFILYLWGITYDSEFPWLERPESGAMLRHCPDMELTVIFEIKKIK